MTKLDFLKDWYQRIWIEADLDAIDRYFVPRAGAEGILPDGQVGAEDFRALVLALRALVRNLTIEVDQFREGEDWLWAHVSVCALPAHGISPVRALRPPTGTAEFPAGRGPENHLPPKADPAASMTRARDLTDHAS